jgi:tol-pal system protein YbgF
MRRLGVAFSCVALAAMAGCATRADLLEVQKDQRAVRALLADQQVAVDGLRRRVDMLRSEISEPGRGHRGVPSSDAARQLKDLEARLAALEQGRATGALPSTPPPGGEIERPPLETAPPPPPPPTAPALPGPQEAALAKEAAAAQNARVDGDFREGLSLVGQGQCAQAVPKLRDFIRKNPKSDFADNAQYWIGACYYGQRDYSRAIVELNDLVLKYPKGDKVPPALLMMADALADSGDKIDARLVLQKLMSQYPQTEEAGRARQKLQSLSE